MEYDEDFPVVETSRGPVRGRTCLDYYGNRYYSFIRVPYAEGPSGPTRFSHSPSDLIDRWTEPLDCTFDIETQSPPPFTEEGCLYANIYTPMLPTPNTKYGHYRPVLVFIPGENATLSIRTDLEKYGPQHFMTEGIVLIVLSYRSGILGFAKTQDKNLKNEVPGYAGYGDIVQFFKWLKYEHMNFGGNDMITPFGQGSGAALIVESLYARQTEDHCGFAGVDKVIVQSSNSNKWIGPKHIDLKEYGVFAGLALAQHTDEQVLDLLRSLPIDYLLSSEDEFLKSAKVRNLNFRFLRRLKELKNFGGKYAAVLVGFNSNEGIMDKILVDRIDKNVENVDQLLRFIYFPDYSRLGRAFRAELVPQIKEYFYRNGPSRRKFMQILSDLNHNIEAIMTGRMMPSTMLPDTRVWMYRFAVDGQLNLVKRTHDVKKYRGACFGDELGYLFKVPEFPAVERGSLEDVTIRRMVKLWANFARWGTPNPNPRCQILGNTGWKPLANANRLIDHFSYLNIGETLTFGRIQPELIRLDFWHKLLKKRAKRNVPQLK